MIGFITTTHVKDDTRAAERLLRIAGSAHLIFCDTAVSKMKTIARSIRVGTLPEIAVVNHLDVQHSLKLGKLVDIKDHGSHYSGTFLGETVGQWPMSVHVVIPDLYEFCVVIVDLDVVFTS